MYLSTVDNENSKQTIRDSGFQTSTHSSTGRTSLRGPTRSSPAVLAARCLEGVPRPRTAPGDLNRARSLYVEKTKLGTREVEAAGIRQAEYRRGPSCLESRLWRPAEDSQISCSALRVRTPPAAEDRSARRE